MTLLAYEFSERSKTVDFMDMTITLNNSNMIVTTLFETCLNLHLYIPPHSAHPPGLLLGIVYSTLFHIFTLCSCDTDRFLIARGHKGNEIRGLFHKAITRETSYNAPN